MTDTAPEQTDAEKALDILLPIREARAAAELDTTHPTLVTCAMDGAILRTFVLPPVDLDQAIRSVRLSASAPVDPDVLVVLFETYAYNKKIRDAGEAQKTLLNQRLDFPPNIEELVSQNLLTKYGPPHSRPDSTTGIVYVALVRNSVQFFALDYEDSPAAPFPYSIPPIYAPVAEALHLLMYGRRPTREEP